MADVDLEVMTPSSPRWRDFLSKLCAQLGTSRPAPPLAGCRGNLHHATTILENMRGIDVARSLTFFREHGGFCDCEILFNVDTRED